MRLTSRRSRCAEYSTLVRPTIPVGDSEGIHGLSDARARTRGAPTGGGDWPAVLASPRAPCWWATTSAASTCGCSAAQAARLGLTFAPVGQRRHARAGAAVHDAGAVHAGRARRTAAAAAHARPTAPPPTSPRPPICWPGSCERARRGREPAASAGRASTAARSRTSPGSSEGWRGVLPIARPAACWPGAGRIRPARARADSEPARRAALRELRARLRGRGRSKPRRPSRSGRRSIEPPCRTQVDLLTNAEQRVPVLTIHQAKGLEFDVVFVAGCSDGDLPRRRSMADGAARRSGGCSTSP